MRRCLPGRVGIGRRRVRGLAPNTRTAVACIPGVSIWTGRIQSISRPIIGIGIHAITADSIAPNIVTYSGIADVLITSNRIASNRVANVLCS
jgi:hypothetical protein